MSPLRRRFPVAAVVALALTSAFLPGVLRAEPDAAAGEERAEQAVLQAAASAPRLRALLVRMPKGADLHMHLSGAVYAETFLAEAKKDLLCADPKSRALVSSVGTTRSLPPQAVCPQGAVPVEQAFADQALYDALIDSFSMRTFVPVSGTSGHDQFFATFDRYDPTHSAGARHGGEWVDEVATRAAAQNEQYLEIMHTPDLSGVFAMAHDLTWPEQPGRTDERGEDISGTTDTELAQLRQRVMASAAFRQTVTADQAEFARLLRERREREHCDAATPAPGCAVEVHFLFQVLRALPTPSVFVQTLLAFEVAEQERAKGPDATVVGLNFVQPEDWRMSMAEYTRGMRIIAYLHGIYPQVHISLHAGELAAGMVPPEGLRFHIRQAVELAHAERIGHGVDLPFEDDADGLLHEMAERHIMTEINLTSNDVILNVKGPDHPLSMYRAAGVPVALSTDDEGVSRIDLTHEFVRAVLEQHADYRGLKRMVRTSLEHSFLPGASLWRATDDFSEPVAACAGVAAGTSTPRTACAEFLRGSRRATQQWELERRLLAFEHSMPPR